jgi:hypothetical protein
MEKSKVGFENDLALDPFRMFFRSAFDRTIIEISACNVTISGRAYKAISDALRRPQTTGQVQAQVDIMHNRFSFDEAKHVFG